jgi:hypothetical protein
VTAMDVLNDQFKLMKRAPDYFLSILRNPEGQSARQIPMSTRTKPEDLMGCCRYALRCQQEYDHSPEGMEADFFRHIDRQKSKGTDDNLTRTGELLLK